MIRPARFLFPAALLMTLSACAGRAEFDRVEMQDLLRQSVKLIEPRPAAGAVEGTPTPSTPFRLGLFFMRQEFPTRHTIVWGDFLSRDKDALLRTLAPLHDQHLLSEVMVIADSAVPHPTLTEIRKAAGRYGADVIVVVTGVGAVDRYNNGYAAFYPTILGAYLAPGTVSEALFLVEGSVWDVRSGLAYGTLAAEGQAQLVGPAMSIEDREALAQAKAAALKNFGERLDGLIRLAPNSARPLR